MYMPVPAISQAMIAPIGPVALAKVRGREKMPAPTMPPTTMVVRANSESFCVCSDAIEPSPCAFLEPPAELERAADMHGAVSERRDVGPVMLVGHLQVDRRPAEQRRVPVRTEPRARQHELERCDRFQEPFILDEAQVGIEGAEHELRAQAQVPLLVDDVGRQGSRKKAHDDGS